MAEMIMTARRLAAEPSWQRLAAFIVLAMAAIAAGLQLAAAAKG